MMGSLKGLQFAIAPLASERKILLHYCLQDSLDREEHLFEEKLVPVYSVWFERKMRIIEDYSGKKIIELR